MNDDQVIFEPGAVVAVGSIHGDGLAVELQLERYELTEGVSRVCASEADVRTMLREVGVSEAKADAHVPRIWREMMDALRKSSPPDPLPPHRLP